MSTPSPVDGNIIKVRMMMVVMMSPTIQMKMVSLTSITSLVDQGKQQYQPQIVSVPHPEPSNG